MKESLRQQILRFIYPLIKIFKKISGRNVLLMNKKNLAPPVSIYSLYTILTNNDILMFDQLKGKKILIVNTASNCGYTYQYNELERLHKVLKDELSIIAFPSNDFKEQEKGSDAEIAAFCKLNYGIEFSLAKKTNVLKGPEQNPVFKWLTNKELNGWNDQQPLWNFSKYLVNELGILTHYFDASISPLSKEITEALHSPLPS